MESSQQQQQQQHISGLNPGSMAVDQLTEQQQQPQRISWLLRLPPPLEQQFFQDGSVQRCVGELQRNSRLFASPLKSSSQAQSLQLAINPGHLYTLCCCMSASVLTSESTFSAAHTNSHEPTTCKDPHDDPGFRGFVLLRVVSTGCTPSWTCWR